MSSGNYQLFPRPCSGCARVLTACDFYRSGSGFTSRCKNCTNTESKNRYKVSGKTVLGWMIEKRYSLTQEQYESLRDRTEVCGVCQKPFGDTRGESPALDHCHESGKLRGFVHGKCNTGLGMFGDDPDTLYLASVHALKSVDVLSLCERM